MRWRDIGAVATVWQFAAQLPTGESKAGGSFLKKRTKKLFLIAKNGWSP
jgi:hypothetical protein